MKVYKLKLTQFLAIDNQVAWDFFSSPANLAAITPPRLNFKILSISNDDRMHAGQIIQYKVTVAPLVRVLWETEITEVANLRSFTDVQRKGPYSHWVHRHSFTEVEGGTEMTDELEYSIPFGPLGRLANFLFVANEVKRIFNHRYQFLDRRFNRT